MIAGGTVIIIGLLLSGVALWGEYKTEQLDELMKSNYLPGLSARKIGIEELPEILSTFHSIVIAEVHLKSLRSFSFIGGTMIGLGIGIFMGLFNKRNAITVELWDRIQTLEEKLAVLENNPQITQINRTEKNLRQSE